MCRYGPVALPLCCLQVHAALAPACIHVPTQFVCPDEQKEVTAYPGIYLEYGGGLLQASVPRSRQGSIAQSISRLIRSDTGRVQIFSFTGLSNSKLKGRVTVDD